MKSQLAEVQTGFEPLLFHIQADFQWQRPFSEGCGGCISEKSEKNLSQSYGRWIVGFHEPMTSAFFALKKGATDWRYDMNEELTPQKERFLREVEQKLLHRELDARLLENGLPTSVGTKNRSARLIETVLSVSDQRILRGRK